MRPLAFLFLTVMIGSCGTQQEEKKPEPQVATTPYGSVDEVRQYMLEIEPFIRQVSSIHQEIYSAVGSSGNATGENLVKVIQKTDATSKLRGLIEGFNKIAPPPLLATLHRDIEKLMVLRADS